MGCSWEKSEIPKGYKGKQIQEDWKHRVQRKAYTSQLMLQLSRPEGAQFCYVALPR